KYMPPVRRENRYFFTKNDGLQNQPVLYSMTGLNGEARPLLDPNTLTSDGTVALTNAAFSKDGRRLAYALSANGSDQQTIRIRDTETGEDWPDKLEWSRFADIAWMPDGSGFFFN